MTKPRFELILKNSSDCELQRFPIPHDDLGFPLTLAAFNGDVELRSALAELQPGDTLTMADSED